MLHILYGIIFVIYLPRTKSAEYIGLISSLFEVNIANVSEGQDNRM